MISEVTCDDDMVVYSRRRKKSGGKFKYREKDLNAIRTSWGDKKLLLQEVLGAPQAVTFHLLCTIQTAT